MKSLFSPKYENLLLVVEEISSGISVGGRRIPNIRYADDRALIEGSKEAIKPLTTNVNESEKKKVKPETQC